MLNSWFGGPKSHEKSEAPETSTDLHRVSTNSADIPDDAPRRTPPTGFTSPHDAVLAQMRGEEPVEDDDDGLLRDDIPAGPSEEPVDGQGSANSAGHDSSGGKEFLYDPFDGTTIGILQEPSSQSHPPTQSGASTSTRRMEVGNKEQWIHLSRVLDLQNEVAKMHLDMEGVGPGDGKGKGVGKGRGRAKGKARDGNAPEGRREWGHGREGKAKPQRSATGDTIGGDTRDGDEEGVDAAGDEEIEMKKAREEQFANLADQFEDRNESIQEIMNKLDHLSKALTEFHTLQAPTFEFSTPTGSRQNSTTPDRTPPLTQVQTRSSYTSTNLPAARSTNRSNSHRLRPVLPTIQSSSGSLPSSTPAELEPHVIPASLSRTAGPVKPQGPVATMIMNALEPGKQIYVMDSPDSMKGHLKLPDS
ncbi:hypothetical protein DXG03_008490 [Asterophora parasitica]|uniref:Uncharacterized protein n=1 Tax=Asterophora parasitica TaxID=117018 RepID=A0A9P7GIN9_9AGAR|nr:hypothetical protein DXG03_008490 [Asterophora parasitica]